MAGLQPRMRAGDEDRQRVVEQLGKHFAEGRLTVEEFDERAARAHAAVHLDELPALTADLPREPVAPRRPQGPPMWLPPAVFAIVLALAMAWTMVALVHGAMPVLALLLLLLLLRRRRWSRRW